MKLNKEEVDSIVRWQWNTAMMTEVLAEKAYYKYALKKECRDCGSKEPPYHKEWCTMGDTGWN